jgi:predicted nucleic acid-binding protein
MPVLDGFVAATAAVAGLTLATRNTLHMQHTGAVVFDPWTG